MSKLAPLPTATLLPNSLETMKRILIVDDEEDICQVVQASLEEFGGWQTVLAHSGQEGLTLAQAEHPDAILLDVSMPEMDGFEMFETLQGNPATQQIPVILLTSKVLARRFIYSGHIL